MLVPRRIYVSSPIPGNLDDRFRSAREELLERLQAAGYEPQEFGLSGLPESLQWTFRDADQVMRRCQGAVIMAFPRQDPAVGDGPRRRLPPTEYNHFEGALAVAHKVPRLIIVPEDEVPSRGIAFKGAGELLTLVHRTPDWLDSPAFQQRFHAWRREVEERPDVFLAYASEARNTARAIHLYLRELDVTVQDWAMDFQSAGTIMDEVERAVDECRCGIFLFTNSDKMEGDRPDRAAPRDNVVFEAGLFMRAKGKERTLIVREAGAKMPTDLGGVIYEQLDDRDDISTIERKLRRFLEARL
jgi:hypothetical protein